MYGLFNLTAICNLTIIACSVTSYIYG